MARPVNPKNEMRRIRSFNLDQNIHTALRQTALEEDISMSDLVNRILFKSVMEARIAVDVSHGVQTVLNIHVHDQSHRDARKDGKCNPKSKAGRCGVCWE
tara:strand:+ start:2331 stop:2630 length:300 start_codon:yes stop_codon:yes gene_type:complete